MTELSNAGGTDPSGGAFVYGGSPAPESAGSGPAGGSILDRLRSVSAATLEAQIEPFPVPKRPGVQVGFSTYLPEDRWEHYGRAHAEDRGGFAKAILVAQCREIRFDGEVWLGSDQMPVTFKSQDMKDMLEVVDAFDAVQAFYIRAPDILRTGDAVLRACGWDLQAPLDPTQP